MSIGTSLCYVSLQRHLVLILLPFGFFFRSQMSKNPIRKSAMTDKIQKGILVSAKPQARGEEEQR